MSSVHRERLGKPAGSYSLGVSVLPGKLVFISGTVALDEKGAVLGHGSMEAQARTIFDRIETLLGEAGGSLEDVVKLTAFVTDMSQYDQFAEVRNEIFGEGPYPASSTVGVSALFRPGLLLEVEALAVL